MIPAPSAAHPSESMTGAELRRLVPRGARCLLVASTGGHLAQLNLLAELLDVSPDSLWVSFENHQSSSLLAGRDHTFVPYIGPRQGLTALKTFSTFSRLVRQTPWDAVISTGAAIAAPALTAASLHGRRAIYIESVSRIDGPSLTGRMMQRVPGVATFTQHSRWADRTWREGISVFDAFVGRRGAAGAGRPALEEGSLRVFTSLGTIRPYRFDSLVDAVVRASEGAAVDHVWQVGTTDRSELPGVVHTEMGTEDFTRNVSEADIVITHAGVATCLQLVQMGVHPIVVPRRAHRNEHVDDHQNQIAEELSRRGLCTVVEAPELTRSTIESVIDLRHATANV